MEKFYSRHLQRMVQQINKTEARKLFDQGETVYIIACNMRFDNYWQHPMPAQKDGYSFAGYSFDVICNDFSYYNCDNTRGKYPHFYIAVD